MLDLNRVAELDYVRVDRDALIAGARANWTALLAACAASPPLKGGARGGIPDDRLTTSRNGVAHSTSLPLTHPLPSGARGLCPEFAQILERFGAPQIRHVGTIGGNIANASPIADALPFLFVMEATLTLASAAGRREVEINDFYHGYKQFDLRPDELIVEVRVPLPAADEHLRLYKISRRRDLDISTFTAAIRLRLSDERVELAAIALGGVAATVVRARRAEQFLLGQEFTKATMHAAGDVAAGEIAPITDVRGAADYRRQLARNVLVKFYYQAQTDPAAV
jgi:xanthine dehydrogenase small subunit